MHHITRRMGVWLSLIGIYTFALGHVAPDLAAEQLSQRTHSASFLKRLAGSPIAVRGSSARPAFSGTIQTTPSKRRLIPSRTQQTQPSKRASTQPPVAVRVLPASGNVTVLQTIPPKPRANPPPVLRQPAVSSPASTVSSGVRKSSKVRKSSQPNPATAEQWRTNREQREREMGLNLIELGKKALLAQEPYQAFLFFASAQRWLGPQHAEANFYTAITRLLSLPMQHHGLFSALGFRGPKQTPLRMEHVNPLRFTAVAPAQISLPSQIARGVDLQRFVATEIIPDVRQSLEELNAIPPGFVSTIPLSNPLTGASRVEVDDADVALSRAATHVALAALHLTQVYNVDVDLERARAELTKQGAQTIPVLLARHPAALRLQDARSSSEAKAELLRTIDDALTADRLIRAELDDQRDDLFSYSTRPQDIKKRQAFNQALADLRRSLEGLPESLWTLTVDQLFNLGALFDRPIDLRSLGTGRGIQAALLEHVLSQIQYALNNLRKAPASFSQTIDRQRDFGLRKGRVVEVDYGDVLALRSALESLQAGILVIASYNMDVNIEELAPLAIKNTLNVNLDILGRSPKFLRLQESSRITEATTVAEGAIQSAIEALAYLKKDDDTNQRDDLIPYQGWVRNHEPYWQESLRQLKTAPWVTIIPVHPGQPGSELPLNLRPLVQGQWEPRGLLPKFDGFIPVPGTLPDPTLSGVLPTMTQQRWAEDVWPEKIRKRLAPPPPQKKPIQPSPQQPPTKKP